MRANIYPRTIENMKAILLYYFPLEKHSIVDEYAAKVYDERIIALNQLEWLCKTIYDNKELLNHLYPNAENMPAKISMSYTAIFEDESKWKNGKPGLIILNTLKEHLG